MFNFTTSPTVCYCINVDEVSIVSAIKNGADSLAKVNLKIRIIGLSWEWVFQG